MSASSPFPRSRSGWEVGEARRPFAALLDQLLGAGSAPVRVVTHERVSEVAMHGKHVHADSVGSVSLGQCSEKDLAGSEPSDVSASAVGGEHRSG